MSVTLTSARSCPFPTPEHVRILHPSVKGRAGSSQATPWPSKNEHNTWGEVLSSQLKKGFRKSWILFTTNAGQNYPAFWDSHFTFWAMMNQSISLRLQLFGISCFNLGLPILCVLVSVQDTDQQRTVLDFQLFPTKFYFMRLCSLHLSIKRGPMAEDIVEFILFKPLILQRRWRLEEIMDLHQTEAASLQTGVLTPTLTACPSVKFTCLSRLK